MNFSYVEIVSCLKVEFISPLVAPLFLINRYLFHGFPKHDHCPFKFVGLFSVLDVESRLSQFILSFFHVSIQRV